MPRLFRNHPGQVALATCVLTVSLGVNLTRDHVRAAAVFAR